MRRIAIFVSTLVLAGLPLFAGFSGTELILPAVGRVAGAGGSQFYTTVWITNPGSTSVDFEIDYLLAGQANLNPARVTQSISPHETKTYENIAETLFGIKGLLGAARIRSSADLIVSSRIYNISNGQNDMSSQGLFYAAIPSRFGIAKGESSTLQGVRQNVDYRYNVFVVECEGKDVTLRLRVVDPAGNALGETTLALQPYEQHLVGVGTLIGNVTDGVVEAAVLDGDGRVIISGSQIANGSQDASGFEMAFRSDLLGSGTITGVTAANGLTGGGTSGNVTLGIAAGGVTAAMLAPGSAVRSVNGLKDDVKLVAGANTSISNSPAGLLISTSVSAGPQGPPGPQGLKGPAGLNWRGAWSNASAYSASDAVSFNGASYVAIAANTNLQPDTNPGSWNLLADRANFTGAAAGGDLSGTYPNPSIAAATSTNTAGAIVRRDGSGNFSAGTITATLSGNATSATNFSGPLAGDVTGTQAATVVANVGGLPAANVAAGASAANAATNASTPNAIVKRDALGNFAAGTITGTLSGNATSATNFSGSLAGDVTGTQAATVVANVGGLSAANVAAGASAANAATSASAPNAIVRRDVFGNFAAGTITGVLNGSATNFTGSLGGEVTGSQGATVVSNAVSASTANTIVRRDVSGGFSAGPINVASVSATGGVAFNTAGSTLYAAGSLAPRILRIISGHILPDGTVYGSNTGDFTISHPNAGHYIINVSPALTNWVATNVQPSTTLLAMGLSMTTMTGDPLTAVDISLSFGGTPIDDSLSFIIVGFQ